jgi:hypothetical protein
MAIIVNSADWSGISSEEQQKIRNIIGQNFEGQTVEVGDGAVEGSGGNTCTTICNEAQKAAEIACNELPWPASTICKIAAEKAGDYCRSRC